MAPAAAFHQSTAAGTPGMLNQAILRMDADA
jgi:hypothetical protein